MLDRDELLAQVARDYYEERLTQDEIGRRINASRSTVSRLLQQAVDRGIVRIIIDYPWERTRSGTASDRPFSPARGAGAAEQGRDDDTVREGMGVLAARLIDREVTDGAILGISYGRSLACTIAALSPTRRASTTVVPIIGALARTIRSSTGRSWCAALPRSMGASFAICRRRCSSMTCARATRSCSRRRSSRHCRWPARRYHPDGHRRADTRLFEHDLGRIPQRT